MDTIKTVYLRNPHFWAILLITLALFAFYQYWPWRALQLGVNVWRQVPFFEDLGIMELQYKFIGSLFIIPIIYGIVAFGWRRALIIWLVALIMILPNILSIWHSPEHLIMNIMYFLIPICASSLVFLEIEWRVRTRKAFAEREKERSLYLSQIIEAQENERRRISSELHDDTLQTLVALANQLETILARQSEAIGELIIVRDEIKKSIEDGVPSVDSATIQCLKSTIDRTDRVLSSGSENIDDTKFSKDITLETIDNLRSICINLRPATLDKLGLIPALRALANLMYQNYKIDTRIAVAGEQRKLPPQTEVTLYRVVQEALSNVRNHSNATYARVAIEFQSDQLVITIEDNGEGFNTTEVMHTVTLQNKMGLTGMKERLKLVNGIINIRSTLGQGTAIFIEVPLTNMA